MLVKNTFTVRLFYDVISPYSWLAFEGLLRYKPHWSKAGIKLVPCSIRHVFEDSGNAPPLLNPKKSAYIAKDAIRAAEMFKVR